MRPLMEVGWAELCRSALQVGLSALLQSTLLLALGLLAVLIYGDPFGHEVIAPMAEIILGGLVTTALFSLFILPALYLRFAAEPAGAAATSQLSISQGEVPA